MTYSYFTASDPGSSPLGTMPQSLNILSQIPELSIPGKQSLSFYFDYTTPRFDTANTFLKNQDFPYPKGQRQQIRYDTFVPSR